jgi:hypothetical protein
MGKVHKTDAISCLCLLSKADLLKVYCYGNILQPVLDIVLAIYSVPFASHSGHPSEVCALKPN